MDHELPWAEITNFLILKEANTILYFHSTIRVDYEILLTFIFLRAQANSLIIQIQKLPVVPYLNP